MIVDFTNCKRLLNDYDGANPKQRILYNGEIYMLKTATKLEPDTNKPLQASYSNAPLSEHIGSSIYEILSIPAQNTILGQFDRHFAVACKDFIRNNSAPGKYDLIEFKKLESSFLGSSSAAGATPLYDNVVDILNHHEALTTVRNAAISRYWQMFAVDSLIGNFDRHSGNWGFLRDLEQDKIVSLAPVYDCGSCLYPQMNETAMQMFLFNRDKLIERVKTFPTAALRIGRHKVRYHEFLLSPQGELARQELLKIYPKINLDKIGAFIETLPIKPVQKDFYRFLLDVRCETILLPAYELAQSEIEKSSLKKLDYYKQEIAAKDAAKAAATKAAPEDPTKAPAVAKGRKDEVR